MRFFSAAVLTLMVFAAGLAEATAASLEIRYITADRVYIDGGSRIGLAPGDRLSVVHGTERVAELEVVFAATHSASCRLIEGRADLQPGDGIIVLGPKAGRVMTAASPSRTTRVEAREPALQDPAPAPPVPVYTRREPERRELRTSFSGSLTFDWEQFTDESGFGRDFDRTSARASFRGRNLGGTHLQFRVRSSTRSLDRVVDSGGSSSVTETRDRLYEAALSWEPPEGRFALRLGRLRLGRYAGAGTIDGLSGEVRLGSAFRLGLFGGTRSDVSDFGVDSDRTSYGMTARWTSEKPGSIREVLLAGAREDGILDVSREYVALQTRLTGGRWSFYQRAEVDLNNGWRQELADSASQLSALFVNATARVSASNRLTFSYSQFERYRTEETRFIPEELFDESQRQGLRARWTYSTRGGLAVDLSAGLRERDGDADNSTSAGFGVRHNDLFDRKLSLGLSLLTFSNPYSDGNTAILRAGKRFGEGHNLTLTAGARLLEDTLRQTEDRETQWLRLGGWFELPRNLFARTELEVATGDDLEGQRLLVSLGYRL